MNRIPRCRRCGRRLKTPDSVVQGIGPTCLRKEEGKPRKNRQLSMSREWFDDPEQLFLFAPWEVAP